MSEPIALSAVDSRWTSIKYNPLIDLILLVIRPRAVPITSSTLIWIKRHPVLASVSLAYGMTWIGSILFIANPAVASQRGTTQMLLLSVPSGS